MMISQEIKTTAAVPRAKVAIRYKRLAARLSKAHPNNMIPCVTWLRTHGYVNFEQYMRAHPKMFSDTPQENRDSAKHEEAKEFYLELAKELATDNGGILPTVTWLTENDYSGLVSYMSKHPGIFKNVERDSTSNQHVRTAEEMARNNGGQLPGSTVIIDEQGWALYKFIRRNIELFRHIPGAPTKVTT